MYRNGPVDANGPVGRNSPVGGNGTEGRNGTGGRDGPVDGNGPAGRTGPAGRNGPVGRNSPVGRKESSDLLPTARLLTAAELRALGLTQHRTRQLVRQHALMPVARGLYAPGELARRANGAAGGAHLLRAAAAVAVVGRDAAVSHEDAALIHGINVLRNPGQANANDASIAVTRPAGSTGRRTGRTGIALHVASLPPGQVTVLHGIRVTSAARTVVDLSRNAPFRAGVVAADSALHAKLTTKDEIQAVLAACRRWPGIQRAQAVVRFSDARPESVFESIARVVFSEQRLPPPELQVWVGGDDLVIGRVDFLWRGYRTVAEADGARKYADPDRARLQLQRDAELRAAGFEVIHFTWNELHLAPWQVTSRITAAFRRATSH